MTNIFDYIDSFIEDTSRILFLGILSMTFPILEILNLQSKPKKRKKMSFEKKVGETFNWKDKTLVVKRAERCEDCFFYNYMDCAEFIFVTGPCTKRKDGNNVKFVELKKENDGEQFCLSK